MERFHAQKGLRGKIVPPGSLRFGCNRPFRPPVAGRVARVLRPILLLLLLGVGCPGGVAAAGGSPVVARVYQEAITADMLAPSEEAMALWRLRFGDELAEVWAQTKRRDALVRQIVGTLLPLFCAEQAIVASEVDIQGYLAYLRGRIAERRGRLLRAVDELAGRNLGPDLTEQERNHLLGEVEHLAGLISRLDEELATGDAIGNGVPWTDDAQHALARSEVLRWKGYQALYERYGGEVVGDARGLVPIGALRALVAERLNTFGVVLLDPDYADVLEDFRFPYIGTPFSATRRQAEYYFSQPWWIRALKDVAAVKISPLRPGAASN